MFKIKDLITKIMVINNSFIALYSVRKGADGATHYHKYKETIAKN